MLITRNYFPRYQVLYIKHKWHGNTWYGLCNTWHITSIFHPTMVWFKNQFCTFPHYHPLILQHHQWSRIRTNGGWTWAAKGAEHCWTGMMGNQFDDLKLGFNHHTCLKHGDYMGNHAKRKPPVDVLICFAHLSTTEIITNSCTVCHVYYLCLEKIGVSFRVQSLR